MKSKLTSTAMNLLLEPSDYTMERVEKEFHILEVEIEDLKKIDITGIEPMWTPAEKEIFYLREDEPGEVMSTEEIASNTENFQNDQIVIKRVVK